MRLQSKIDQRSRKRFAKGNFCTNNQMRSPERAQRNPGTIAQRQCRPRISLRSIGATLAALHPGNACCPNLFEKGSVVPPPIPVILAAYDPEWPRLAASHSRRLQAALGSALVIVHHIGSTSVPGLAAKPIIDLMPLVSDLAELDRLRGRVEALGYGWHGELGITGDDIARLTIQQECARCSFISSN